MPLPSISYLGQIRIGLCLVFLTYASVVDKRTGYVSNRYWRVAMACAMLSAICDCILSQQLRIFIETGFSFVLTFTVALAMFRIGLFGGSDAKALIALSLFIPTASPYLRLPEGSVITSLSTLVNLVTLLSLIFCINALRNVYFLHSKDETLMSAWCQRKCGLLVLFGYRRVDAGNQIYGKTNKFGDRKESSDSYASIVTERKSDPSRPWRDRSMEPLKVPLIPIITLSLLFSLLIGDLPIILLS